MKAAKAEKKAARKAGKEHEAPVLYDSFFDEDEDALPVIDFFNSFGFDYTPFAKIAFAVCKVHLCNGNMYERSCLCAFCALV